jgi:uncharacterized protein (TIGR00725 family)
VKLFFDRAAGRLSDGRGRRFDPGARLWKEDGGAPAGEPVDLRAALAWLQRDSGRPCRVPVGVIGSREATAAQLSTAEWLGEALAGHGLTVICGGREGVMEAACRGVERAGGVSVGLLPDADPTSANPHVTIPIATGIGVARNAIIARASLCLVAVGGGHGTTAEVAFGLQFGVPVFGLSGAPELDGVRALPDAEAALDAVARVVLGLPLDA